MTRTVMELRENDPQQTAVGIDLNDENDDGSIAQALEQNQYISRVRLRLAQRDANWDHLCRVLATRRNLVNFVLFRPVFSPRAPAERIHPILHAIQQNASVRVVEFCGNTWEAEDLCSFLDAAVHVTDLTLNRCVLTGGEHGARDVAGALRRNTNIATLTLRAVDNFLDTVLEGLASNSSVRRLVISSTGIMWDAIRDALQGLLESTQSIQYLELDGIFFTGQSFGPIAQGLIHASIVTEITLNNCTFNGEGSIRGLNQILERKQSLRSLAIMNCTFSRSLHFPEALFSALHRPASPLRHFQFDDRFDDRYIGRLSNQSFSNLCQAVAESKLESFAIRVDHNHSRIQSLANTIPFMKIRTLVIRFVIWSGGYHDLDHGMKQTLRQALKNNFTLQSVKFQCGDDDQFDASDVDQAMKFFLERNTRLDQWVENPATVPKHLWKKATTLAAKAGPETLFRLLRKIGPEVLPVGSRKRKRSG